jgi:hypothetical protein
MVRAWLNDMPTAYESWERDRMKRGAAAVSRLTDVDRAVCDIAAGVRRLMSSWVTTQSKG